MVGEKMCQMLARISLIIMLETTTEPSTWPQIPLIQRPPTSSLPATMMSQVDVPMIRVSIPCLGVAGVGFREQMGEHFLQGRIKFFENFAGRKTPTIS